MTDIYDPKNFEPRGSVGYLVSRVRAELFAAIDQELAPFGVRVLAVGPGAIKTAINRSVWSDPAGLADLNTKIPMGRMGEAGEVAQVVAFLASDAARYISGAILPVDGGWLGR